MTFTAVHYELVGELMESDWNFPIETETGESNSMSQTIGNRAVDKRAFFESEVTQHMDRFYGAALRLTRHSADAEDLVADAIIQAWNKFEQLEDTNKFCGWMMRIISNKFLSNLRQKQPEISFSEEPDDSDDTEDAYLYSRLHRPFLLWWGEPEKEFMNNLLRKDIETALDALPEAYRIVVILVEIMGCQYSEVAEELKIPVGTVRSRLNRGRQYLQKSLWEHAQESGLVEAINQNENNDE